MKISVTRMFPNNGYRDLRWAYIFLKIWYYLVDIQWMSSFAHVIPQRFFLSPFRNSFLDLPSNCSETPGSSFYKHYCYQTTYWYLRHPKRKCWSVWWYKSLKTDFSVALEEQWNIDDLSHSKSPCTLSGRYKRRTRNKNLVKVWPCKQYIFLFDRFVLW